MAFTGDGNASLRRRCFLSRFFAVSDFIRASNSLWRASLVNDTRHYRMLSRLLKNSFFSNLQWPLPCVPDIAAFGLPVQHGRGVSRAGGERAHWDVRPGLVRGAGKRSGEGPPFFEHASVSPLRGQGKMERAAVAYDLLSRAMSRDGRVSREVGNWERPAFVRPCTSEQLPGARLGRGETAIRPSVAYGPADVQDARMPRSQATARDGGR